MKKLYLTTAAILLAVPAAFATSDVEPVVVVKGPNGPVRISATQYDERKHERHIADENHDADGVPRNRASSAMISNADKSMVMTDEKTVLKDDEKPIARTAPREYGVMPVNGKFVIVDRSNAQPVTDVAAFDPNGYASNKDAWDVITAAALASSAPATDNA